MDVVKKVVMSGEIMMASMNFVVKPLELSICFAFIFLCLWSFILWMKSLALSKIVSGTRSCAGSETEIEAVLARLVPKMLSSIARIPLIFLMHS